MKKTLIIAYYWPPAGGPGVQRWLKFVKYLREFDIEPVLYVPENPSYPIIDESLMAEVPADITIIRKPIVEPYKLAQRLSKDSTNTIRKGIIPSKEKQGFIQQLMIFIRGNFFIPDARKRWVKPSVEFLSPFLIENEISSFITTGPPHSLHLIGQALKERTGLRWIADFRDPWTGIGYHNKLKLLPWAKYRHKALEKKVLNTADEVVVTSPITKTQFEKIRTEAVTVITNGYDDVQTGEIQLDKRFTISHIGTLLTDRNPDILWDVLHELVLENNTFKSLLQINLIGQVGVEIIQKLEEYHLTRFINLKGYVPHQEAVKHQRQSQLLLLIEIDSEETRCIIPGKLFEYMASNRPIIALGPENSDVEQIITKTNTGSYFKYDQRKDLKKTIISSFESFRKGELKSHGVGIQAYHRRNLTKLLADLIAK
ncbi:MAG: glycosyl transferase family 1 [Bacteroidia bacterium]|nr:glycosyl transferase family 1 [Bacteroidia bacterium]NNK73520.1 glycosyl transferase family 1 [Flavobacteriaceae bacterium]